MEFINFIANNNITSYEVLKSQLEASPYNLKLKEDDAIAKLALIHSQDTSDFTSLIVKSCNGLVIEKETLKVVCYTFDKFNDSVEPVSEVDYANCSIQDAIEGTLLRVYFYDGAWRISTKKCLCAGKSRWVSEKNFQDLFIECHGIRLFEHLNKDWCYSFIMAHPENNVLFKPFKPTLYHLVTRDMTSSNLKEVSNVEFGCEKEFQPLEIPAIPFGEFLKTTNIKNIYEEYKQHSPLNTEGYVFIDEEGHRHKIIKNNVKKVRAIWGNNNNRLFRYLELRKDIKVLDEYLNYFKEDKQKFLGYENEVMELANEILEVYMKKFVLKTNTNVPFYFKRIIYNLHGDFLKNREQTNISKVTSYVNDLDVKEICHMINNLKKDNENKNQHI